MSGTPRCRHCKDVIGVYEPIVVVRDGDPRRTSRAAEQDLASDISECYHSACYSEAHCEDPQA